MRHQLPLSPLQLTPDEIKQFHRLAQAHRSPQAMARRTRIVLTWCASGDDEGLRAIRSQMACKCHFNEKVRCAI